MPYFSHRNFFSTAALFVVLTSLTAAHAGEYDDAVKALNRKQYASAINTFRKLANAGDANAQFRLGGIYLKGQGVKQSQPEAVAWFRKAAQQGHADAQNSLGVRYEKGQGIAQDYKEAIAWYRKSALQRFGLAQENLADLLSKGLGTAKDDVAAYTWATLAIANGEAGANAKRAAIESRLTPAQMADAQYRLSTAYAEGDGVKQDATRAAQWLEKAAAQGHPGAQYQTGDNYDKGIGVAQDYRQALTWFEKAAAQNETRAQSAVGYMYDIGQGVAADPKRAQDWYEKAAAGGDAFAQYNLGSMYGTGRGIERNDMKAYMWFSIAEDNVTSAGGKTATSTAAQSKKLVEGQLTPEQIAEAQRLAREWMRQHGNQKNP